MNIDNITKGEWKRDPLNPVSIIDSSGKLISNLILQINGRKGSELDANAELICEAANVTQSCNLSPAQLLQQNKELREALKHCVLVFKSQADRGLYPLELMPYNPNYLGKQGFQFALDALSKHPNK